MRPRAAFACLGLVAMALGAGPARGETRHLIAVGSDTGLPGEGRLRFAERDAERVAEVFVRVGGVAPERARLMRAPDAAAVESALLALREARDPPEDRTVIFYFSGHGDEENLHLGAASWPIERLEAVLADVPARTRMVVLDACRGPVGQGKGLQGGAPAFALDVRPPEGPAGTLMLRSAAPGEQAQESDELQGALFTHAFLAALQGAADRDADGRVTFTEAWDFAQARALSRSAAAAAGLQHAALAAAFTAEAPWVLSRPGEADGGTLIVPAEPDVQYLAFSAPAGTLAAEFWSSAARTVALRLPAGLYLVHRRARGDAGAAEIRVGGAPRRLRPADFTPVEAGVLVARGGELTLHPHRLAAGLGLVATTTPDPPTPEVSAQYIHSMPRSACVVGLRLRESQHDDAVQGFRERVVGVQAEYRLRGPLGPLTWAAGLGVDTRLVFQRVELLDAARRRAARFAAPTRSNTALAAGPRAAAALDWLISGEGAGPTLGLELSGDAPLVRTDAGLSARGEVTATLRAGWAL